MAINPKSQNLTNSAPRASTQKNYQETSNEIEKRGNKTRRVEETDDEQKPTFENSEHIMHPSKINLGMINEETDEDDFDEDEDTDDESDYDDDESEEEDDESYDEDEESEDDSEEHNKIKKTNQQKVPAPLNGNNRPRTQTPNEHTSQPKRNDRKI